MRKYRRKKKDEVEKREIITEPTRRSIYDVVQSNLKIAKRVEETSPRRNFEISVIFRWLTCTGCCT
jgi:hypothetical protein